MGTLNKINKTVNNSNNNNQNKPFTCLVSINGKKYVKPLNN